MKQALQLIVGRLLFLLAAVTLLACALDEENRLLRVISLLWAATACCWAFRGRWWSPHFHSKWHEFGCPAISKARSPASFQPKNSAAALKIAGFALWLLVFGALVYQMIGPSFQMEYVFPRQSLALVTPFKNHAGMTLVARPANAAAQLLRKTAFDSYSSGAVIALLLGLVYAPVVVIGALLLLVSACRHRTAKASAPPSAPSPTTLGEPENKWFSWGALLGIMAGATPAGFILFMESYYGAGMERVLELMMATRFWLLMLLWGGIIGILVHEAVGLIRQRPARRL